VVTQVYRFIHRFTSGYTGLQVDIQVYRGLQLDSHGYKQMHWVKGATGGY